MCFMLCRLYAQTDDPFGVQSVTSCCGYSSKSGVVWVRHPSTDGVLFPVSQAGHPFQLRVCVFVVQQVG
jgi:hypothetical protein